MWRDRYIYLSDKAKLGHREEAIVVFARPSILSDVMAGFAPALDLLSADISLMKAMLHRRDLLHSAKLKG